MEKTNIFKCQPPEVHFTIRNRVPYNKLLTNLACSSRTGEYWPSVVLVLTLLRSVRTATTSGQYFPVRPSRSVSKRLIFPETKSRGISTNIRKTEANNCFSIITQVIIEIPIKQRNVKFYHNLQVFERKI